jgi:hypothetical protein
MDRLVVLELLIAEVTFRTGSISIFDVVLVHGSKRHGVLSRPDSDALRSQICYCSAPWARLKTDRIHEISCVTNCTQDIFFVLLVVRSLADRKGWNTAP